MLSKHRADPALPGALASSDIADAVIVDLGTLAQCTQRLDRCEPCAAARA
jgi:hypothetical protein